MSHMIAIASGKGGVGKTFVTATLSIALARQGFHVLAVDADMGLRNLDLLFGLQDDVLYDLGDVMKKRCQPGDAILSVTENLDFLAASQKHTWEKIDASTYQYMVENIGKPYDYVLVDCPPGRGNAYKNAVAIVDRIFFVVEPTWSSMRDTARLMQFCNKHKRFNYDVLFNNFYRRDPGYVGIDEMLAVLNPEQIAGILPHDPIVHEGAQKGTLVSVPATAPVFQALDATVAYIKDGTAIPVADLLPLLPDQEVRSSASPAAAEEAAPTAPSASGDLGRMKALAAAELQKAAAIWAGTVDGAEPVAADTDDAGDGAAEASPEPPAPPQRNISLRQRKQQSLAWRLYRR